MPSAASFVPATMPGIRVLNVALTSFALRPMVWAIAVARSASIPTMVVPSEARNSFGG